MTDASRGLEVTVLGCGTSIGVPVVACDCAVCTSTEPRNHRTRPSLCLRWNDRTVIIDTTPDFRMQCLRHGVRRVDAVLYTHAHADHVFGLDDLRAFNFRQRGKIPCYGSALTLRHIRKTFSYVFDGQPSEGGGKPQLDPRTIDGPFELFGRRIEPIPVLHGSLEVTAFRLGAFAYVTDTNHIPDASLRALAGVEILILDALHYRPTPTHFSIEQAIEVAAEIGARQTWLTHLSHNVDYTAVEVELPRGVELAYDGLHFRVA
ncbi:MAG: MBL fold metallo-hydrolase [Acidobacteriota bacterium]